MSTIFKLLGNLISIVYGIVCMPITLLVITILPIISLTDSYKIITTGYTVKDDNITICCAILFLIYISLRFKYLRKIYNVFPFLFEYIKYMTIASLFTSIGQSILNICFTTVNNNKHILGIVALVICLILWRVFISVYYFKRPLVDFLNKDDDMIKYEK